MELQARIMELFAKERRNHKARKELGLLLVAWVIKAQVRHVRDAASVFYPQLVKVRHPSRAKEWRDLTGLMSLGLKVASQLKTSEPKDATEEEFLKIMGGDWKEVQLPDPDEFIQSKRGRAITSDVSFSPGERTAFEAIMKGVCRNVVELMRMLFPGVRSSTEQGGKPYAEAKSIAGNVFKKIGRIIDAGSFIRLDRETQEWWNALYERNLLPATSQELTAIRDRFFARKTPQTSKRPRLHRPAKPRRSDNEEEKKEEEKPSMPPTSSCSNAEGHHWVIEKPSGPTSTGVCKYCKRTKEFSVESAEGWGGTSARFFRRRPPRPRLP